MKAQNEIKSIEKKIEVAQWASENASTDADRMKWDDTISYLENELEWAQYELSVAGVES